MTFTGSSKIKISKIPLPLAQDENQQGRILHH